MISKEEFETINTFFDKIHRATVGGDGWVETSPEIIKHYNKSGVGPSEYFIFQGIKVCEYGQKERIEKNMKRQLGEILYGKEEGKVNQMEATRTAGSPT